MKNQYFGDINDYRKYGLLRCFLDTGMRIGVCWMLTPPDGRPDGNKIMYLSRPDEWRRRDPQLFDVLQTAAARKQRHVSGLERSGLLPAAKFYSEPLCDDTHRRVAYFNTALKALEDTDLLFFDPDTGLEVSSVPYGQSGSSRYLYWREVEEAGRRGGSLVVFQHWKRENRVSMAARLSADFARHMPPGTVVIPIFTDFVLFLCACAPKHAERFEETLGLVALRWDGELLAYQIEAT